MVEVIRADDPALGKSFVERAVIAEARGNVSPFGQDGLIGCAAGDVAACGHGAEGAAVVALTARDDAIARGLTALKMKLSGEFDGGFRGFRAAGSEIDAAAGAEIRRGKGEEALR